MNLELALMLNILTFIAMGVQIPFLANALSRRKPINPWFHFVTWLILIMNVVRPLYGA